PRNASSASTANAEPPAPQPRAPASGPDNTSGPTAPRAVGLAATPPPRSLASMPFAARIAFFFFAITACVRAAAPVPDAILAVARRTAGEIDFAMLAALARRAPTVVNLGNHEPEFFGVEETVARLHAAGVLVVGGNTRARATGRPFAPASVRIKLGEREAVVVGVVTDDLATFRAALRPDLDLTNPVVWAREHFPALLNNAELPIVLSHSGVRAEREMLPLVPAGTLFAGAHDHLRFAHREGRTVYFHSGSWTEFASIARLYRADNTWRW